MLLQRLMLVSLTSLALAGCSTNAATGRSVFTGLMSSQQEQSVGDEQHDDIIAQYGGVSDNAQLNQFVAGIGAKLVPTTERRDVAKYTFTVLNTDDVNAFAVPGGYIYITRGLLNLAQDEAQVAGVLAHELAHIQAQHSAQQYSQTAIANIGVGLLGAVIGGTGGQMASQAAGFGAQAGLMKYSRDHEYESDSLGIRYMQTAGYDPEAMGHFLTILQKNTEFESRINGGGGGPQFTFLSTHPSTPERVKRAFAIASQFPKGGTVGRDTYLAAIDGTTYGGSTKSGFVRGNDFIHPDLGFRFTVPDGFNIENGTKQVVAENGRGAVIVFDMGKGQSSADQYLLQSWLPNQTVGNVENISINGSNAATGTATVSTSAGTKDGRFIAIPAENGQFYRLAYLTPQGQQGNYAEVFRRSSYSFKVLSSAERNGLQPNRVRVATIKNGDTVASLAKKMVVADNAVDRFCLLNGVQPDDPLTPGWKVKIVQGN